MTSAASNHKYPSVLGRASNRQHVAKRHKVQTFGLQVSATQAYTPVTKERLFRRKVVR